MKTYLNIIGAFLESGRVGRETCTSLDAPNMGQWLRICKWRFFGLVNLVWIITSAPLSKAVFWQSIGRLSRKRYWRVRYFNPSKQHVCYNLNPIYGIGLKSFTVGHSLSEEMCRIPVTLCAPCGYTSALDTFDHKQNSVRGLMEHAVYGSRDWRSSFVVFSTLQVLYSSTWHLFSNRRLLLALVSYQETRNHHPNWTCLSKNVAMAGGLLALWRRDQWRARYIVPVY